MANKEHRVKQSLGLLEVCGLALAISCADIMAKSASITLLALEKTNGSGWMVIKIAGDVASVQAAITTSAQFAEQRNGLVAHKVIARPGEGILLAETPSPSVIEPEPEASEIADVVSEAPAEEAPQESELVSCNLCLDPKCPRQKGEPRTLCIHSGKRGEA
ncbi:TPA: propanediol utilization microcompartment protein PduK [Salmonella enterica subsp. enterica serovar Typhi]|uniref:propanediol utilization microcompartment protein PduK n=1 Tax=Salmonella enterica TaxID=28901 RepID=UPI00292A34B1|nr:propanediol utilization microcompartment protein PduK [Salmonella enterica]HEB3614152.1 propanediol utilization microcompartment protein PduK [Salmonella enterica subsp. enterica serovar Typhi]EKR6012344.1 propanediol utilization microcompartment protein PduK [Salmonella enterica]EME1418272.1 propanediol utilization microcompartment protein PduK [Salmonella enterica]EME5590404.1 propanediol utilization microcompartment protein PduK [Salmonella enterica]